MENGNNAPPVSEQTVDVTEPGSPPPDPTSDALDFIDAIVGAQVDEQEGDVSTEAEAALTDSQPASLEQGDGSTPEEPESVESPEEPPKDDYGDRFEALRVQERQMQEQRVELQTLKQQISDFAPYKAFAEALKAGDAAEAFKHLDVDPVELIDAVAEGRAVRGADAKNAEIESLKSEIQQLREMTEQARTYQQQVQEQAWEAEIQGALNKSPHAEIWSSPLISKQAVPMIKQYQTETYQKTGRVPSYSQVFDALTPKIVEWVDTIAKDPVVRARIQKEAHNESRLSNESKPLPSRASTASHRVATQNHKTPPPDLDRDDYIAALVETHSS